MSYNTIMTHEEALCFRALRRWQRAFMRQQLVRSFIPYPLYCQRIKRNHGAEKFMLIIMSALTSPLWLLWWLLSLSFKLLSFPFRYGWSFVRPAGLRAPGERNIKGLHYQFSQYIDLPPELYIRVVDDWVRILYGPDKLPRFSLQHYLDADYLLHRRMGFDEDDEALKGLLKIQISNAREELSSELGHY